MMKKKKGIFERLSGSVKLDDDFDVFDDEFEEDTRMQQPQRPSPKDDKRPMLSRPTPPPPRERHEELPSVSGELGIDMFETPNDIIIRTFVAGVRPDALDISIARDVVTISGARESQSNSTGDSYFHNELYWGAFSRRIMLPVEIDVESSTAASRDGLLTITLPKLDKARQTKLKVRAG
jgi:HSP20 family molecular chaperone IbpA